MCMNFVEVPDLGFLWHLKSCFSDLQSVDLSCYIFVMQYYRGAVIDGDYAVLGISWVQDKGAWAQWCLEELFTACNNTALCLVLFQEKLLRLLEQWTSPGPCTTSGSLPHPSSITPQSAPRWQAWAACTTPHGSLWELVRCS